MDGNGRWAGLRGKSRIEGHRRGRTSVRTVLEMSRKLGIPYLSLFAFSAENWLRPKDEVHALMGLLEHYLAVEQPKMMRHGIRLLAIGDKDRLPAPVLCALEHAMEATRENKGMTVLLALSYSGRDDIVKMVRNIARKVGEGTCAVKDIDEEMVSAYMETDSIPDPDPVLPASRLHFRPSILSVCSFPNGWRLGCLRLEPPKQQARKILRRDLPTPC